MLRVSLKSYIEQKLSGLFPEPDIGPLFEMEERGMEATLYSFNLQYSTNTKRKDQNLIVKIYNGPNSNLLFDPSLSAKLEYLVSNHVANHDLAVPEVFCFEEKNNTAIKYPFIIMKKLDGMPLHKYIKRMDDPDDIRHIWQSHARLLHKIHTIDYDELLDVFGVKSIAPRNFLHHDLDLWNVIVRDHKIHQQFDAIIDWLQDQCSRIHLQHYCLIHRDFYLGNVFCTFQGDMIVLDWGISYISDYRLALGYTLMHIRLDDSSTISRDEYLELYEQEASLKVENIIFFEILALIKDIMIKAILTTQTINKAANIGKLLDALPTYHCLIKLAQNTYPDLAHEIIRLKNS